VGTEFRVSFWTAAKARKLDFGQSEILIRFIAERKDYTTNPKAGPAISGRKRRSTDGFGGLATDACAVVD
jgi:hypothetical protein